MIWASIVFDKAGIAVCSESKEKYHSKWNCKKFNTKDARTALRVCYDE